MKKEMLSKRLLTVVSLVEPGSRVVDVGTDHGFVPITLVKEDICPSALAMDVGKGPLARAREHIEQEGLSDQIEVRLSDGFAAMQPGEADSGVIAGMGGPLMVRILEEGRTQTEGMKQLVLSPQSDIGSVRRYIKERKWKICQEVFLQEEGKYYTVMQVALSEEPRPQESGWEEAEDQYGVWLLQHRDPVLLTYLEQELETKRQLIRSINADTNRARERLTGLQQECRRIEDIKEHYYEVQ